jgi:hypothetical protein
MSFRLAEDKNYFCKMFTPIPLNLPPCALQLSTDGKVTYVWDRLRKKKLVCTPEEWVRQHWIDYLIAEKGYPKALLKCEHGVKVNGLAKRSDLLVFDREGQTLLLAEFKSPYVPLNQDVVEQVIRYNSTYQIPYILVSNGLQHGVARIDFSKQHIQWLEDLPHFDALTSP